MTSMKNGTKVFIAGSRRLSRLNNDVTSRIDSMMAKNLTIIIGDANGVDRAVQEYLSNRTYAKVNVFCMDGRCRNNVGDWPIRTIAGGDGARRDFSYYSTKDRAMVQEADYGLMLWDGKSRGTLRNIVDLVRARKSVVVYIAPAKSFCTLRQSAELAEMLSHVDPAALQGMDRELQAFAVSGASTHKGN
jgi:hypothetical protein